MPLPKKPGHLGVRALVQFNSWLGYWDPEFYYFSSLSTDTKHQLLFFSEHNTLSLPHMQWTGLWPQLRQAEEMEPLTPQKRLGLPLPDDRMIDFFWLRQFLEHLCNGRVFQWVFSFLLKRHSESESIPCSVLGKANWVLGILSNLFFSSQHWCSAPSPVTQIPPILVKKTHMTGPWGRALFRDFQTSQSHTSTTASKKRIFFLCDLHRFVSLFIHVAKWEGKTE